MSDRLATSLAYIKTINPTLALRTEHAAKRLATTPALEKWLKLSIGTKEKMHALKPGFMKPGDQKDDGYRKAARAHLLVELVFDYHGTPDVDTFLAQRKQAVLTMTNELAVKTALTSKLNGLTNLVAAFGTTYRVYDDRNSTAAGVQKSALEVSGRMTGAPAVLRPAGKWKHHPQGDKPGWVDFCDSSYTGIFSMGAGGGCIVVAFLYGGKRGQPLKGVTLVHTGGGNYNTADWAGMGFLGKTPTSIVVFLSTMNAIVPDQERDKFLAHLTGPLGYAAPSILFHYTDSKGDHGIDKWGHFGKAFSPDVSGKYPSTLYNAWDVTF